MQGHVKEQYFSFLIGQNDLCCLQGWRFIFWHWEVPGFIKLRPTARNVDSFKEFSETVGPARRKGYCFAFCSQADTPGAVAGCVASTETAREWTRYSN